ncbi:hypothetical protein Hypma_007206 [Hypsizygus marmoreus]|uniref:Uncharacterized protein n=1 Tax=Hypsizygus marmoreus TaxID=39966 RepID=A0A369KA94_HYPMA|nr:hypothetical protein Hypma_007206 [Hypsizygus marmoreus]
MATMSNESSDPTSTAKPPSSSSSSLLPTASSPEAQNPRKSILRTRHDQPRPFIALSLSLSQRIPPEVIDLVIENVSPIDIKTLGACALVSKAWLAAGRHRLFLTVTLNESNAGRFMDLLDAPYLTIANSVHEIFLVAASNRPIPSDLVEYYPPRRAPHHEEIARRLSAFPSLTSLCVSWVLESTGSFTAAVTHSSLSLTELEFRVCKLKSFSQFTRVLAGLQSLRRLIISDVEWYDGHSLAQVSTYQRIPARLQTLELYTPTILPFCSWLSFHAKSFLELDTLRLCSLFWDAQDASSIGQLLKCFGPKIKHLSLPWHFPEIDLSYSKGLRSLHFTHLRFQTDFIGLQTAAISSDVVERTLYQLTSPILETIDFTAETFLLDYETIGRILTKPCFSQLKVIRTGVASCDRNLHNLLKRIHGSGKVPPLKLRRRSAFSTLTDRRG